MKPLILISNDDGIRAEGIQVLAKFLRRVANVVIVAPDGEQSASSHSLTLHRPLRVFHHAPQEYSVDGTPTDCVMLAVYEILKKKPDLIVSGINRGANLGDDVHYSGTVSAAMEGALMGIPSVAVSLVAYGDDPTHFQTAAQFIVTLSRKILKQKKLPQGFVLNVNVPNFPTRQIKGSQFTCLGKRDYGEVIFKKVDPRGKKYYWIGGDDRTFENIPESDGNAIKQKKISITPLQVDMTHQHLLQTLRRIKL
ncbi:MAG: 5'/3'-nucleotidase SurE [Deltaproteobacteria bacterium]|nr:5'/3'-nucleotidase SurE [Deltaproteobacteria bacterium]